MKFSIIIPTLDEAHLVKHQVSACLALRPGPEVIVEDGGSSDEGGRA
jgi:glycosyltransferase involved in cell wall biosynthesis